MTDLDALRSAYRGSWTGAEADHLSEDRWERLASGELAPEEREGALDHILECAECAEIYTAVSVLRAGAGVFDSEAPVAVDPSPAPHQIKRRWWGGVGVFALAAAAVLAIILPRGTPPTLDPVSKPLVLRSIDGQPPATPVSPVDQALALQSGDELQFSWVSREPESRVRVEVLDADGELVWTSPATERTDIAWPSEAARKPGRYYWRVVATGSSTGGMSSELASFELVDGGVIANPP